MSKHRFLLLLAPFVIVIVFSTVGAHAQERKSLEEEHGDVVALAETPKVPLWSASAEAGYLPSGNIRGSAGDLSLTESRAGLDRRFPLASGLELLGGLRYSLQKISAPDAARLPEELHAVSVTLGGEYRASDRLSVGLRLSPGVSSDFRGVTGDDVRVPVSVNVRYRKSKALTLLGGIIYTGGSRAYPVLPLLGALYMPTERWVLAVGFPRTGVLYRFGQGAEWYAGIESGRGEYRLHDPRVGADIISYSDLRGATGVDMAVSRFMRVGIVGGYCFYRRILFYEGSRDDLRVDNVPFGKVQLKFAW